MLRLAPAAGVGALRRTEQTTACCAPAGAGVRGAGGCSRSRSVSRSALVRVEGAWYAVPERWAWLSVTAWVGMEEVTLSLGAERVSHPRQRFGGRRVSYRHYLGELSRKPQAVRQVAPELLAELGEPYGRLWAQLEDERGGH